MLSLIISFNSFAQNKIAECNGCNDTQYKQKATEYSNLVSSGSFVYIFDFTFHSLKKFYIWKENLNNFRAVSNINTKPSDPIKAMYKSLKELGIKRKDVIAIFDSGEYQTTRVISSINNITFVMEVTSTTQEINGFNDIDDVTDRLAD